MLLDACGREVDAVRLLPCPNPVPFTHSRPSPHRDRDADADVDGDRDRLSLTPGLVLINNCVDYGAYINPVPFHLLQAYSSCILQHEPSNKPARVLTQTDLQRQVVLD